MNTRQLVGWVAAATFVVGAGVGCKGDDDDDDDGDSMQADAAPTPDSAPEVPDAAPSPDAFVPAGEPSCDEFTTPSGTITAIPGMFSGDISNALANVDVDPASCATSDAFPDFTAPGPEQVVKVTGLTPGNTYFARADSVADLALYVVTGCEAGGIPAGACLHFEDGTLDGVEAAAFVAPMSGEVFLVVDTFQDMEAVSPGTFTLTVDEEGCTGPLDCAATTPLCDTSTLTCAAGPMECTGDDAAEMTSDDGPSGATSLDPMVGNTTTINAGVCTTMVVDEDWYKFTTANAGDVNLSLDWMDTAADLDIVVVDSELNVLGESYWQRPEPMHLTFLPAGTYYVIVTRYDPMGGQPPVTPYSLTFTRNVGLPCVNTASCASTFEKQRFRATCDLAQGGSCVRLEGNGMVAAGALCDSNDDCAAAAPFCAAGAYTAGADTRSVCAPRPCTTDAECQTALGANGRCSTGLVTGNPPVSINYCHLACTASNQCLPRLGAAPAGMDPWAYGTCAMTGACTY